MTKQRFEQHFCSPTEGIIVHPAGGSPTRRLDGKPMMDADKARAAGRDPYAAQLAESERKDQAE